MQEENSITFYTSIATGALFVISEILPFLPITSNGLVHSIVTILTKITDKTKEIELSDVKVIKEEDKEEMKKDIIILKEKIQSLEENIEKLKKKKKEKNMI
jgi:hypothetical protein